MGQEEVIEEAFVDVFCDLIYGGGWMDLERIEETDRECNWALVSAAWLCFSCVITHERLSGRIQGFTAKSDHNHDRTWHRSSDGHLGSPL